MTRNNELTTKQRGAILTLLSTNSIAEAARETNISERTFHRWMKTPEFIKVLNETEKEVNRLVTRRIFDLQNKAIDVLNKALNSKTESIRLRAAKEILNMSLKYREISNIETRMQLMEVFVREDLNG